MKRSLVIALALMLVLAFASSAMAAQLFTITDNVYEYQMTPKAFVYGSINSPKAYDSSVEYPYGIYLPDSKTPANYRIHSNYAKNTDACASCHSTHTAVGNNLLQWYSTYDACMACHDGTVSTTYDVLNGRIGTTNKPAMGGAFESGSSASNHNVVNSATLIAAAPGGSIVGDGKSWNVAFGCESCHTPHGNGGNPRILNPNPNDVATKARQANYAVSTTGAVYDATGKPVYIIKGYPYDIVIKKAGVAVAEAYIDNTSGVSQVVYPGGNASDVTLRVEGTAALQVEMFINNYLQGTETVQHISGMNAFCGACHTDYNTEGLVHTSDKNTGTYSQAHRHQVGTAPKYNTASNLTAAGMVLEGNDANINNNKLECLTCHVAHGVNQDYWERTVGPTAVANGKLTAAYLPSNQLVELAGSSALKRIPNMGTCEACHQKGASAQGTTMNADATSRAVATDVMPNTYIFTARLLSNDIAASDLGWVGSSSCLTGCHKDKAGWTTTGHATSGHNATALDSAGCAQCHNPGANLMWTGVFNPTTGSGVDDGITCESCHGTGKNHILAPSKLNIFNPGSTDILRQTIECGRCHDMYANKTADTGNDTYGLNPTLSGSASVPVGVYTTQAMYNLAKAGSWSPAFRVAGNDPAKFTDASQLKAASTHFGGAWGYVNSKHFLGTGGTIDNPQGVVSCTTCHDMHSEANAGALRYTYDQVCTSCHDASANLAIDVAMPTNSWQRHQLELEDFSHSFQFTTAGNIGAAVAFAVNLEQGISATGFTPLIENYSKSFKADFDINPSSDKYRSIFPAASGRTGGIGFKLEAFTDATLTTQVYNNYGGTFELLSAPSGLTRGTSLTDAAGVTNTAVDYVFEEKTGAIELNITPRTFNMDGDAGDANNTVKIDEGGQFSVKWTSKANPSVTATSVITIVYP